MENHKLETDIQGIEQAILNEVEGENFYRLAATQFEGETREIFLELADQEQYHVRYLENLKKNLGDSQNADAQKLSVPSPGIFRWERIDASRMTMALTVLSTGIQLEQNSVAFYEKARDHADREELKTIYQSLADWEKTHVYELTEQYEIYKKDWWAEQRFSAM